MDINDINSSYALFEIARNQRELNLELINAIIHKNEDKARFLLDKAGIDLNAKDEFHHQTPLQWAAYLGQLSIVKCLLEKKAHVDGSEFKLAAENGHLNVIEHLYENTNNSKDYIKIAFFAAAEYGRTPILAYFIKKGLINKTDESNNTALMLAVYNGHFQTVEYLVEQCGADVNCETPQGKNAISCAIEKGDINIVTFLFEKSLNSTNTRIELANKLIIHAIKYQKIDIIEYLIKNGADVNKTDHYGKSVLQFSFHIGSSQKIILCLLAKFKFSNDVEYQDIFKQSVRCGHNLTIENLLQNHVYGNTDPAFIQEMLVLATEYGCLDVVKILIKYGAKTDEVDIHGNTLMMYASYHGHSALVNYLFEQSEQKEIELEQVNVHNGTTPLILAAKQGHDETVDCLIQLGARNLDHADNEQKTALIYSVEKFTEDKYKQVGLRLVSAMTLEERIAFAHNSIWHTAMLNKFKIELSGNLKKIFNMVRYTFNISAGSKFLDTDGFLMPDEIVNHILAMQVLSIKDFPVWYRHRVVDDLILVLNSKIAHKVPALIFSAPVNNKRKAEDNDINKKPAKRQNTDEEKGMELVEKHNAGYSSP